MRNEDRARIAQIRDRLEHISAWYDDGLTYDDVDWLLDALGARDTEIERLRTALSVYHALMANVHAITNNAVGSVAWREWMDARAAAQKTAQEALKMACAESAVTLVPVDNGFEVHWQQGGHAVGFVYPDPFGGWRPYSFYGQCLNSGEPALATPLQAAYWGY